MTDESRHPIGEYLDANRDALASMYLYEHPEKDTAITLEEMETWLVELLDEGFREHHKRIELMNQLEPKKRKIRVKRVKA